MPSIRNGVAAVYEETTDDGADSVSIPKLPADQSGIRRKFYKDALTYFWMAESCRSLNDAISQARGLRSGKLAEQFSVLMAAFPEMDEVVWTRVHSVGRLIGTHGLRAEYHFNDQHASIKDINDFLVGDTMLALFEAELPTQYAAIMAEQERRQKAVA